MNAFHVRPCRSPGRSPRVLTMNSFHDEAFFTSSFTCAGVTSSLRWRSLFHFVTVPSGCVVNSASRTKSSVETRSRSVSPACRATICSSIACCTGVTLPTVARTAATASSARCVAAACAAATSAAVLTLRACIACPKFIGCVPNRSSCAPGVPPSSGSPGNHCDVGNHSELGGRGIDSLLPLANSE